MDINTITNLEKCAKDKRGQPLVCYGCAHSAGSVDATFPGKPSGERPCFFCTRNVDREKWQEEFKARHGSRLEAWYDQSKPLSLPMDCYHSVDMVMQIHEWDKKAGKGVKINTSEG